MAPLADPNITEAEFQEIWDDHISVQKFTEAEIEAVCIEFGFLEVEEEGDSKAKPDAKNDTKEDSKIEAKYFIFEHLFLFKFFLYLLFAH